MPILDFPETRQTFCYDCGANALASVLVYVGVELREDEVMALAGTTKKNGTDVAGILRVLDYFGIPHTPASTIGEIVAAIDAGHPVLLTLQAYGGSQAEYVSDWEDGHWVVAIGYEGESGDSSHDSHDSHDPNNPGSIRRIVCEDPSSYTRTWIGAAELLARWHDMDGSGKKSKKIRQFGCAVRGTPKFRSSELRHMD
jgi:ABC-type bacteriocin/lantibiotic exporter with double-glycine peptidase domain